MDGYLEKGIVVHLYKLINGNKFYFAKDKMGYVRDKNKAEYGCFSDVNEFNSFLEENIERLIEDHGENIGFAKRRRFIKKK